MTAPTQDLIDRLQAAAADAKATIREMHEARADIRQLLREVDARMATVRDEVIKGNNALAEREWKKAMDSIQISQLGAGLKRTFDQWMELLADAKGVLRDLQAREEQLTAWVNALQAGRVLP